MKEPKFKINQLVKITVENETRYYHVLEPVWNKHANMYLYRLDEPMAMPVWREDWLEAVSDEELRQLEVALEAGRIRMHRRGYLTVDGGLDI